MASAFDSSAGDESNPHLQAISRVYGPETWEVYALLDRTVATRGPDSMLTPAVERLSPPCVVLDVGCRDAAHLIELVRRSGASGVGIDPVSRLVNQARQGDGLRPQQIAPITGRAVHHTEGARKTPKNR